MLVVSIYCVKDTRTSDLLFHQSHLYYFTRQSMLVSLHLGFICSCLEVSDVDLQYKSTTRVIKFKSNYVYTRNYPEHLHVLSFVLITNFFLSIVQSCIKVWPLLRKSNANCTINIVLDHITIRLTQHVAILILAEEDQVLHIIAVAGSKSAAMHRFTQ